MRLRSMLLAAVLAVTGYALAADAPLFSGKTQAVADAQNGYKLVLPVEFKQEATGLAAWWSGPLVAGGGASVHVNVIPWKGTPLQTIYEANLKSYKENKGYTEVTPIKVKGAIGALTFKETGTVQGTQSPKGGGEIHRWHLMAFGNERQYNVLFGGTYQGFKEGTLPPIYKAIIASFELTPAK
ncbi:MAG: hypothetical protein AB1758_10925 [Candidatus Eremiobacterota bacterium]